MKGEKMRKGFTLIELLVVIVMIGILSVVILVAVNNARKSAKDVRVKSDLYQMARLLETYNIDNGKYITSNTGTRISCSYNAAPCPNVDSTNFGSLSASPQIAASFKTLVDDINSNQTGDRVFLSSTATSWAFAIPVPSKNTAPNTSSPFFCVSSDKITKYCTGYPLVATAPYLLCPDTFTYLGINHACTQL